MPKVFASGTALPASDLNSFVLQPGTAGTGTRIVAGRTAYSMSGVSGINALSISWGFTFGGTPTVTAVVASGSNIDLILTWAGAPTTTGATARIAEKSGTNVTQSGFVHWIAVGPA